MFEQNNTNAQIIFYELGNPSIEKMTTIAQVLTPEQKNLILDLYKRMIFLPESGTTVNVIAALLEIVSNYKRVTAIVDPTTNESEQLEQIFETVVTHLTNEKERSHVRHDNQSPHRNPRGLQSQVRA